MAEKVQKTIAVTLLTAIFSGLGAFLFNQVTSLGQRVVKVETQIESQKEVLIRIDQRVYEIHGKIHVKE